MVEQPSCVSDELTHFVGADIKDNPDKQYVLLLKILGGSKHDPKKPRAGWLKASFRGETFSPGFTMRSDGKTPLSMNDAIKRVRVEK